MYRNKNKPILFFAVLLLVVTLTGCAGRSPSEASQDREASLILRYESILSRQDEQIRALLEAMRPGESEAGTVQPLNTESQADEKNTQNPRQESDIVSRPTELQKDPETRRPAENRTDQETRSDPPEALFTYEETDGGIRITGITGSVRDLVIPEEIDGKPVREIGDRAFEAAAIRSVTVPAGVRSIGWFAFWNCTSLCSVTLPGSVTSIGYSAFDGCAKGFVIRCPEGSYAAKYAASFALQWEAYDY